MIRPNDRITHVMVGYVAALLGDLDRNLAPDSLLIIEDPEVIKARKAESAVERFACVAGVEPARTQDETDPGRLLESIVRPERVRAVIPGGDYGAVGAAALAQGWGLPGAGVQAARVFRDKGALRRLIDDTGIAQPDWQEVAGPDEAERFRTRHGGHCVLKPANRQASLGVQVIGPDVDMAEAWRYTADADDVTQRARYAVHTRILAEERLVGPEYSTEAIVRQGVVLFFNITAKQVLPGPFPIESGHVVPAPGLDPDMELALRADTEKLVAVSGFSTGMLHAEWILRGGRPHLIECAGRPPGDRIVRLIDLAYHGSVIDGYVRLLAGADELSLATTAKGGAAITFVCPPSGVVAAVSGVAESRESPGVIEAEVTLAAGDSTVPITSSWKRRGHVLAVGDDGSHAARLAADALNLIEVTFDGAGVGS